MKPIWFVLVLAAIGTARATVGISTPPVGAGPHPVATTHAAAGGRLVLLYPTTVENHRADVTVLDTFTLPRAQPAGEPALLPPGQKFPLIIFSHGYDVHPFHDARDMVTLAGHGYIVACVWHDDSGEKDFAKLVARRTATLRETIAALRENKEFAGAIDFDRLGAFGISLGAPSVLGVPVQAIFGESPALQFAGATGDQPFFAVVGGEDRLWPVCQEVVPRMTGPRFLVKLPGQGHVPTEATKQCVITTWAVHFFDAYLKSDRTAREILRSASSVSCPGCDNITTFKEGSVSE
jgi:predicted dienelactone hydrolase